MGQKKIQGIQAIKNFTHEYLNFEVQAYNKAARDLSIDKEAGGDKLLF